MLPVLGFCVNYSADGGNLPTKFLEAAVCPCDYCETLALLPCLLMPEGTLLPDYKEFLLSVLVIRVVGGKLG
jgi:hypothetical protein